MVMYKKCGHRDGDIIVILDDWCPKCKAYRISQGQDIRAGGKTEIAQYPKEEITKCEICKENDVQPNGRLCKDCYQDWHETHKDPLRAREI